MDLAAKPQTERRNRNRGCEEEQRIAVEQARAGVASQTQTAVHDEVGGKGCAQRNLVQPSEVQIHHIEGTADIGDWDVDKVKSGIAGTSKKLSVTSHDWMMPFTMLGFTKIAEEQGEWAANTAIALMNDTPPRDIPITANRKWDLWMNEGLVEGTQLKLPRSLTRRAKRVSD